MRTNLFLILFSKTYLFTLSELTSAQTERHTRFYRQFYRLSRCGVAKFVIHRDLKSLTNPLEPLKCQLKSSTEIDRISKFDSDTLGVSLIFIQWSVRISDVFTWTETKWPKKEHVVFFLTRRHQTLLFHCADEN